jgi:hypothetical protein
MIQVVRRVIRVGDNGIVRVEVTLSNSRTGREVMLVTERPDLDADEWAEEGVHSRSASVLNRP